LLSGASRGGVNAQKLRVEGVSAPVAVVAVRRSSF
jgi:hypothetical protein